MRKSFSITKVVIFTSFLMTGFHFTSERVEASETKCTMNYTMKSWSVFYKSGKGSGTIRCDNGQKARVKLRAQGGGLTFGKRKTVNGHGTFLKASNIRELYGSYANAEAHAGAGNSANAQVLTKGEVSLTLTGTGRGVDLGFDFGKFTISRR